MRLVKIALLSIVISAGAAFAQKLPAPIQHAFLVQNSGWMEPFYVDPESKFKPLIAAIANAIATAEDPVHILAFSQSSGANVSPLLLSRDKGALGISNHLRDLSIAKKGAGPALADTDFREAITKTIKGPFEAKPGILWIFTNNKNSPNNDLQTAERNREFYNLVHLEPAITKTLAFPLKMPVKGKLYSAKGLMVYALAYGAPAAVALDRIMTEGRLTSVLTYAPARLKPIDQDALRIVPVSVKNSNVKISLASDRKTLVLDVDSANLVPEVVLQASLENLFDPYVIRTASVDASLLMGDQREKIQVSPALVQNLLPGANQPVEVKFALPIARIPSPWSWQAMKAMGKQVLVPMTVEMTLAGQNLGLSEKFSSDLMDLFPGDPISQVFTPPESVRASTARVPLLIRIQYPLLPVLLVMAGLVALVLSVVGAIAIAAQTTRYSLIVDEVRRNVVLKRFSHLTINDSDGVVIGEVKRGFGRPVVTNVTAGRSMRLSGK